MEARFLTDLGLKAPTQTAMPKVLAVRWRDLLRWGLNYNQLVQAGMDLSRSKYPIVAIGSLSAMIQYGTSQKADTSGNGTPVIRMGNLVNGELDLRNLKHVRLSIAEGDILFNKTNSKEFVGKCAVFRENGRYVFASYLIRVRMDTTRAHADFLAYALNSPIGRQHIDALSRQIIGQANVNSEELRSLQVPLPPLSIQGKLVELVAKRREEIAKLRAKTKAIVEAAKADVEAMILGTKKVSIP
jgi:type I restriction enzyme S subunit